MKKLILIVVILCSVVVLSAQEVPAASNASAVIPGLETAAGWTIGGGVAHLVGLAVYWSSSVNRNPIDWVYAFSPAPGGNSLDASGVFTSSIVLFVPLGVIVSTIAYSNFLENYNRLFPSDTQIMLPFILLTYGGFAAGIPWLADPPSRPSYFGLTEQEKAHDNLVLGIRAVGVFSTLTGMIISVVHTQELLAKARASGKQSSLTDLPVLANRTTIMPDIGANYLGVAISMP